VAARKEPEDPITVFELQTPHEFPTCHPCTAETHLSLMHPPILRRNVQRLYQYLYNVLYRVDGTTVGTHTVRLRFTTVTNEYRHTRRRHYLAEFWTHNYHLLPVGCYCTFFVRRCTPKVFAPYKLATSRTLIFITIPIRIVFRFYVQ